MKIKGAVLREPKQPYSIEELELAPPKEKEALVRYVYTGYCHSDLHNLLGDVEMVLPFMSCRVIFTSSLLTRENSSVADPETGFG